MACHEERFQTLGFHAEGLSPFVGKRAHQHLGRALEHTLCCGIEFRGLHPELAEPRVCGGKVERSIGQLAQRFVNGIGLRIRRLIGEAGRGGLLARWNVRLLALRATPLRNRRTVTIKTQLTADIINEAVQLSAELIDHTRGAASDGAIGGFGVLRIKVTLPELCERSPWASVPVFLDAPGIGVPAVRHRRHLSWGQQSRVWHRGLGHLGDERKVSLAPGLSLATGALLTRR
eukprot:4979072-Prymnesium_polylepis.2